MEKLFKITIVLIFSIFIASCFKVEKNKIKEEISIGKDNYKDSLLNSQNTLVKENYGISNLYPSEILLTGQQEHRLITFYKRKKDNSNDFNSRDYNYYSSGDNYEESSNIMTSFDILHGYNLLNIAHLNIKTQKLNYLFDKNVIIKNFYFPSYRVDTINKKAVTRSFYLASVYDEDTNNDSLINKNDLRRFYFFDINGENKLRLLPDVYSAHSSQFDPKNDIMFIYAKKDDNKSGSIQKEESYGIFILDLKSPTQAKQVY